MSDKELWVIFFHAALGDGNMPITAAADVADKALLEYKKRWEEPKEDKPQ